MYPFHWLLAGTSGTRAQGPGLCSATIYGGPAVKLCPVTSCQSGISVFQDSPRPLATHVPACFTRRRYARSYARHRGPVTVHPPGKRESRRDGGSMAICMCVRGAARGLPSGLLSAAGRQHHRHRRANQQSHLRPEIRICLIGIASRRPNFFL